MKLDFSWKLAIGAYLFWLPYGCYLLTTVGGREGYKSEVMASWVQALGSIGAIVCAALVFLAQRRFDRDDKWKGLLSITNAALTDAQKAEDFLNHRDVDKFKPRVYFSAIYSAEDFSQIDGILDAIPVHEIPYAHVASRIIVLRRKMRELARELRRWNNPHASFEDRDYTTQSENVIEIIRTVRDTVKAIADFEDGR